MVANIVEARIAHERRERVIGLVINTLINDKHLELLVRAAKDTAHTLGNSLRSVTFFLAAGMIIAGIIFVAVGIITSGLRESLSTWKFITGAACFAFGGICAAVYAFSQGETVPLDNQF